MRGLRWSVLLALAAGAVLLTLLRLFQPAGGLWVRGVAFAPYALPAYLVLLVCCLVGARRSRWLLGGAAAALLGAVLHLWWVAPHFTAEAADHGEPLTVMTVNVMRGLGDPADIVRTAAREDVDLLAVQEINASTLLLLEQAGLREHLPHHAEDDADGEIDTVLFSRHPLGDVRPIEMDWDSFAVDVALPGGEQATVVVTHPHSPTPDDELWRSDLATLRDALEVERPDLVLGDFNATPDHEPFRRLLATGLRDVAEQSGSGWQPTWPANGIFRLRGVVPLPALVPIDHVLVGERWVGLSSWTAEVDGTDHLALLAEVAREQ